MRDFLRKPILSLLFVLTLVPASGFADLKPTSAGGFCRDVFSIEKTHEKNRASVEKVLADHPVVRELLNRGRFQEAAWKAENNRQVQLHKLLEKYLETSLLTGISKAKFNRIRQGATSEVFIAALPGGLYGIWKPDPKSWEYVDRDYSWLANPKAEIAAYEIDRALGLGMVPVTVEAKFQGIKGSLQVFVEKTEGHDYSSEKKMQLFDYLINNWDRHEFNRLSYDGRVVAIDHGLAFQPSGKERGYNPPESIDRLPIDEDTRPFFVLLKNRLSDGEIQRVLSPYFSAEIVNQVKKRRLKLIEEFERQIGPL